MLSSEVEEGFFSCSKQFQHCKQSGLPYFYLYSLFELPYTIENSNSTLFWHTVLLIILSVHEIFAVFFTRLLCADMLWNQTSSLLVRCFLIYSGILILFGMVLWSVPLLWKVSCQLRSSKPSSKWCSISLGHKCSNVPYMLPVRIDFWLLCNGKPQLRHVPAAKKWHKQVITR